MRKSNRVRSRLGRFGLLYACGCLSVGMQRWFLVSAAAFVDYKIRVLDMQVGISNKEMKQLLMLLQYKGSKTSREGGKARCGRRQRRCEYIKENTKDLEEYMGGGY